MLFCCSCNNTPVCRYVCGTPVPTSNPMTSTPTQQPSMAPTQWFEHPGHEATVTMLQSAVAELEVTVRNLQAQLAASASKLVCVCGHRRQSSSTCVEQGMLRAFSSRDLNCMLCRPSWGGRVTGCKGDGDGGEHYSRAGAKRRLCELAERAAVRNRPERRCGRCGLLRQRLRTHDNCT